MLQSLQNTGIQARLTLNTYDKYNASVSKLDSSWKESLNKIDETLFSNLSIGISEHFIPTPYNQKNFKNMIFDYRSCFINNLSIGDPAIPYKTIASGGTIPCAMAMVYEYFILVNKKNKIFQTREELLLHISTTLVLNGYRTQYAGTSWISLDKILELVYGIPTKIQSSIFNMCHSVASCNPVIALVPTSWLHGNPLLLSNEAIIVWAIKNGEAIISTTTSDTLERVKVSTLFKNIKRSWACQIQ